MKQLFNLPKLSFIVTSYNYADYIEECIKSILKQTYSNIEIIVVDDHSRDKSVEIIRNIIKNNKTETKIKLIQHKSNKGQLASIIDGILAANGEFISCIDSDDKLMPEYAITHISTHLCKPCALSVCELAEIDAKSTLLSVNSPNIPYIKPDKIIDYIKVKYENLQKECLVKELTLKNSFFGGWWWAPTSCGVFRKSSILPLLSFENMENWRTSPDKLIFNFLHLIGGSVKIYEPMVLYRRHGKNAGACNSILGNKRYNSDKARKKYIKNQINLYKDILEFFKKNKTSLCELYSKKNYNKMLFEIYTSIPKLLLHKLTH